LVVMTSDVIWGSGVAIDTAAVWMITVLSFSSNSVVVEQLFKMFSIKQKT